MPNMKRARLDDLPALPDKPSADVRLINYEAMCLAIDRAEAVDEVKDIRDKALALEIYSRQALNVDAEHKACSIRLRAERRAGELLAAMDKAKGAPGPGRGKAGASAGPAFTPAKTLADHGISKKQSSNWQKLAEVPEEEFEEALAGPAKPTTKGVLERIRPKSKPDRAAEAVNSVDRRALKLCGILTELEEDGMLDEDPQELFDGMLPSMQDDVLRIAPMMVDWLRRLTA